MLDSLSYLRARFDETRNATPLLDALLRGSSGDEGGDSGLVDPLTGRIFIVLIMLSGMIVFRRFELDDGLGSGGVVSLSHDTLLDDDTLTASMFALNSSRSSVSSELPMPLSRCDEIELHKRRSLAPTEMSSHDRMKTSSTRASANV